jgi:hypothetical protein
MATPKQAQQASHEADIHLAISALDQAQIPTERHAAQTFEVPRTTLQRRRAGKPARRDCQPNSKKLTELEEEVITRYILDLDTRGFSPTYAAVRDMADKLLAATQARLVSTGRATLSSVQTVLRPVSIEHTTDRELCVRIQC